MTPTASRADARRNVHYRGAIGRSRPTPDLRRRRLDFPEAASRVTWKVTLPQTSEPPRCGRAILRIGDTLLVELRGRQRARLLWRVPRHTGAELAAGAAPRGHSSISADPWLGRARSTQSSSAPKMKTPPRWRGHVSLLRDWIRSTCAAAMRPVQQVQDRAARLLWVRALGQA